MSDIFDRVKKELEKKELKGSAKNRKDSPDSEDIPDVLLDIMMLHICAHGKTARDRLGAELLLNTRHLTKLVEQISRFSGDKTGKTTASDLNEANSLIEAAIQVIEEFIEDHPIPEKTIFDKE